MASDITILIAAGLATLGWLYTGRRARALSRKQHTINLLTQASFNSEWRGAMDRVAPMLKSRAMPDLTLAENSGLLDATRLVLNHYEFIAAGLRNGDFDETLVRDSQRGTIVTIVEICTSHIYHVRNTRRRQAVYEHIEWLAGRWSIKKPGKVQRTWEACRGRPCGGQRCKPD